MPILNTRRRGGLRGYMPGSSPIPVYSFVMGGVLAPPAKKSGCGCHRRGMRGLGQDDDLNFGIPSGLIDPSAGGNIANVSPAVNYPAAPGSGLVYAPSSADQISGNPQPMPVTTQAYSVDSSGVIPVFGSSTYSPLSAGGSVFTPSSSLGQLFAGSSSTVLLLGGVGLFAALLFTMSGKKKR